MHPYESFDNAAEVLHGHRALNTILFEWNAVNNLPNQPKRDVLFTDLLHRVSRKAEKGLYQVTIDEVD